MNKIEFNNVLDCYDFIVKEISKTFHDSKQKYYIVHENAAKYDEYISYIFKRNKISFTKNYKFSLLSSSFCSFVVSLIRLIKFDFKIDYIIEFLEIIPYIDYENLNILRKYIKIHGIKDISKEFDMLPFTDIDKSDELNVCRINLLNGIRLRCIDLINKIKYFTQNKDLYNLILFLSQELKYDESDNFDLFHRILIKFEKSCDHIDDFLEKFINEVSNLVACNNDSRIELCANMNLDCNNCSIFVILDNNENHNINRILFKNGDIFFVLAKEKIKFSTNFFSKEKKYLKIKNIFSKKINGKYKDIGFDLLNINISQVEKYYLCPFNYFCSNILRLKNVQKFELDSKEYGLLVHYVLEKAIKKYISCGCLCDTYDIIMKYLNKRFYKTHNKNMISDISKRIALNLNYFSNKTINLFKTNNFEVAFIEKKLQKTIKCNGIVVNINGVIDRIDKQDNKIMIIDYKTSGKKFDLNDFFHGLNSQIMIYLNFLDFVDYEKCGAVYISFKDCSRESEKNIKISGISLNKYEKSTIVNKEMMDLILRYSNFLISDMLNNIMECKFSKRILCTKKDFSCNNCFYDKICHNFDIMHTTIKKNDLSNINEEIKRKLNV